MGNSISLCIITKDEEKSLASCIDSSNGVADEIIVADTGSSDATKEIAARHGALVADVGWKDDFSAARNEGLRHATKDWILVLDADEVLTEEGCKTIRQAATQATENIGGFAMEQRSYAAAMEEGARRNPGPFPDPKKYPFFVPHSLVRLFRNHQGFLFRHRIHELVEDSIREKGGAIVKIGCAIHHFSQEKNKEDMQRKALYYISLIKKQVEEHPGNPRYAYQMARACLSQGKLEEAEEWFGKTAALNPRYKLVYSELAKIHLKRNEMGKASECFGKSMELHPDNPSPANNLAAVHLSLGHYAEAKRILEGALAKHPNNKALLHNYQEAVKRINQ